MIVGIMSVLILCKVSIPAFDFGALFTGKFVAASWNFGWFMPEWWPKIAWPWFVFVGCCRHAWRSASCSGRRTSQIAAAEAHVPMRPRRAELGRFSVCRRSA